MIVGVDEVGRGCWAGPLVAGAVLLAEPIPGLKDSKKLSKKQRESLDAIIRERAISFGLGWVGPTEIDTLGLTASVRLAMQRATEQIVGPYDALIIDGNYNFLPENPLSSCLIKADDSVPAVSAASIIAKVARDRYMAERVAEHPGYGFEKHVGYGMAQHSAALKEFGITILHRRSFAPIKALL